MTILVLVTSGHRNCHTLIVPVYGLYDDQNAAQIITIADVIRQRYENNEYDRIGGVDFGARQTYNLVVAETRNIASIPLANWSCGTTKRIEKNDKTLLGI